MKWKPTKPGVYLLNGEVIKVRMKGENNDIPYIYVGEGHYNNLVNDGPWSLLAPDWQEGPPTAKQVKAWPWWYLKYSNGDGVAEKLGEHDVNEDGVFWDSDVTDSAPIQEDRANGPLWVSKEATK